MVLDDTQLIPAGGSNISVCCRAYFSNTIYLLFALAVFSRVGVLFCRLGSLEEIRMGALAPRQPCPRNHGKKIVMERKVALRFIMAWLGYVIPNRKVGRSRSEAPGRAMRQRYGVGLKRGKMGKTQQTRHGQKTCNLLTTVIGNSPMVSSHDMPVLPVLETSSPLVGSYVPWPLSGGATREIGKSG